MNSWDKATQLFEDLAKQAQTYSAKAMKPAWKDVDNNVSITLTVQGWDHIIAILNWSLQFVGDEENEAVIQSYIDLLKTELIKKHDK